MCLRAKRGKNRESQGDGRVFMATKSTIQANRQNVQWSAGNTFFLQFNFQHIIEHSAIQTAVRVHRCGLKVHT